MPRIRCLALDLAAVTLLVLFQAGPAAEAGAPGNARSALGINLAGVTYWTTEIVFVDLFKHSQPWKSQSPGKPYGQGGPLDLTEDGWIRSLAPGGQFADSIVLSSVNGRYPEGVYTCLYDGDGELGFAHGLSVVESKPGRILVDVEADQNLLVIRVVRTNPENPVRNIRFILPGFEDSYADQPFHPEFLKRWEKFKVLRFMDFQRTNNSGQVAWSDRPTPAMQTQGGPGGVALEYMIRLANTLRADPWFCMPHLANDAYVRRFAEMVRNRLRPELNVYVEYSNECWNSIFGQARYSAEQGKQLELSNNAYQAQLFYYSRRAVEIFKIWEEVFGGHERLVRVLSAQSANPWTSQQVTQYQNAYRHADALAIAPYFGHALGSPQTQDETAKMTVEQVLEACRGLIKENEQTIARQAELANRQGLDLIAYEGGQHLVGYHGAENNQALERLFHAANRHPGMRQLYLDYLAGWKRHGGKLLVVFSSVGKYSKWGSWGLMEYHGQPLSEAPKYQAVLQFIQRNPRWW